ncbi:hypothetical protein HDU67_008265 [Dinochytrium kinnereticum]|nr:hypothetical protein HDU67_008265 [Dinochytrium kinnereticum]
MVDMKRTASTSSAAATTSPINGCSSTYSVVGGGSNMSVGGLTQSTLTSTACGLACGGAVVETSSGGVAVELAASSTSFDHSHHLQTPASTAGGKLSMDMGGTAIWKTPIQQQQQQFYSGGVGGPGTIPFNLLLHHQHASSDAAVHIHPATIATDVVTTPSAALLSAAINTSTLSSSFPSPSPSPSTDALATRRPSQSVLPGFHVHVLSRKSNSCSFFVEFVSVAQRRVDVTPRGGPRGHWRRNSHGRGGKASLAVVSAISRLRRHRRQQLQQQQQPTSTFPLSQSLHIFLPMQPHSHFSFPRISSATTFIDSSLATTRHTDAHLRRLTRLHDQTSRLSRRSEHIRYRVLLLRQGERLAALKLRARSEYAMSAASLKRQLILKQCVDRHGAVVEHAQTVAMLQRLRKFLALRRAFSENALAGRFSREAAFECEEESDDDDDDYDDDEVDEGTVRARSYATSERTVEGMRWTMRQSVSTETPELLSRAAGLLHPDPRERLRIAGLDWSKDSGPSSTIVAAYPGAPPLLRPPGSGRKVEDEDWGGEEADVDEDLEMMESSCGGGRRGSGAGRLGRKKIRRRRSSDYHHHMMIEDDVDEEEEEYNAQPARVSSPPPHSLSSRSPSPALSVTIAAKHILASLIASSSSASASSRLPPSSSNAFEGLEQRLRDVDDAMDHDDDDGDDEYEEGEEEEEEVTGGGRLLGVIGEDGVSACLPHGGRLSVSSATGKPTPTRTKKMRRRSRSVSSTDENTSPRHQRQRRSSTHQPSSRSSSTSSRLVQPSTITPQLSISDVGAILSPSLTSSSRPSLDWSSQKELATAVVPSIRLSLTVPSVVTSPASMLSSGSSVSTPDGGSSREVEDVRRRTGLGVLSEPLTVTIKRCKSLPPHLFDSLDETEYLELLGLLPPITRFTLRELDMDEIISNVQLRHDLYFDPNLQFKPNIEGERGDQKRHRANVYWTEVDTEIRNSHLYRLPLLLFEIRCIIVELLPYSDEMREEVERNVDVRLIAQQIEHGVLGVQALMGYVGGLLRANCAPARDGMLDEMGEMFFGGRFAEGLRVCFDVLEMMKLDYANHQLHRLRPYVVEHAIEYERNWFKDNFEEVGTSLTKAWLTDAFTRLNTSQPPPTTLPTFTDVYIEALLNLIGHSHVLAESTKISSLVPETFKMDSVRLVTYRNDWQDITIMSALLILFRQAAGAKCTSTHLATTKRNLWVLLNDAETSMHHIVLELARAAGEIRGAKFSQQETTLLSGMVDKTLSPDSKLYSMISGRVGEHLSGWIKGVLSTSLGTTIVATTIRATDPTPLPQPRPTLSLDKTKIARHGLTELEDEIRDLAERLGRLAEFNRAAYFDVYAGMYEEVRGLATVVAGGGGVGGGEAVTSGTAGTAAAIKIQWERERRNPDSK